MRGYILAFASLTFILVAFQNCSSFESDDNKGSSSQCVNKLRSKIIQKGGWAASECTSAHHYACSARVFSPDVLNDNYEEEECLDFQGMNTCMPLQVKSFSTAHLLDADDNPNGAFDENGSYNKVEYYCEHRFIVEGGVSMIFGSGLELKEAMDSAVEMCLQGVKE